MTLMSRAVQCMNPLREVFGMFWPLAPRGEDDATPATKPEPVAQARSEDELASSDGACGLCPAGTAHSGTVCMPAHVGCSHWRQTG